MQNIVNQQCTSVFKTLAFGIDRNRSEEECRYHSFLSVKDGKNVLDALLKSFSVPTMT